jgi:hypothetical protein
MRSLPRQQDLFEPRPACSDLSLPHRAKAIELLKILLTEATAEPVVEIGDSTKEGAGNDQDHA